MGSFADSSEVQQLVDGDDLARFGERAFEREAPHFVDISSSTSWLRTSALRSMI